ncbi:WD40/YVTN/BNR-like repeat-containing protein [Flavobacterium sp. LB3P122]|uniref:WD40/YVTN/BNR-like repeat-containing protein n=1 Tax=Flavobacterium algoriphilum TaxID=3398738 RepID=UPI003A880842
MLRNILIILVLNIFTSCKTSSCVVVNPNDMGFQSVQIDTLFQDKVSIRAILIDANKIWYAADNSRFGFYDLEKNKKDESHIGNDSLMFEFRSIAQTSAAIFILNVSNPALLYKIAKDGSATQLVYQENHKKVFYDSMQFWNDKEGIAIGDPITNCLSIIITRDGGASWNKISCDKLPKIIEGEGAFAASNTNIVTKGNKTWIVTGGKKARVFYSSDKGKTWEVHDTPIVQGKTMTGIFTADFYDSKKGFIAGGNYEVLNQNFSNKALTTNGGKTWKLQAENHGFGYTSCVQYVPESDGRELVSVGASGLYYSSDSGISWKQLTTDSNLFTIRFLDKHTAIAAGKNKMVRLNFKK